MASNNVGKLSAAKGKRKRGVILLLVVSLLALFLLIGVTYAILATNYFQTTKIEVRQNEYGDLPEKEFDLVLGQLLYDTAARSAMRYHSLLGDLYGNDTVYNTDADGNTTNNTKVFSTAAPNNGFFWGGQAYAFQVLPTALQSQGGPLIEILDYYSGRVLTFTEGPAANYSARILQYDPTMAGGPQFIIELDYSAHETINQPVLNNHFAINGAPFNGPGAGYDYAGGGQENMDAQYGDLSFASITPAPPTLDLVSLLPHFNGYDPTRGQIFLNGVAQQAGVDAYLNATHHDESWDAVDYQNMFLAMVPPTAARLNSDNAANNDLPILPSYHRQELVNYWLTYINNSILAPAGVNQPADQYQYISQPYGPNGIREPGVDDATVPIEQLDRIYSITRGCIFRPMPWDHPNFTGSNPAFDSTNADILLHLRGLKRDPTDAPAPQPMMLPPVVANLWDVDNDNDQTPDSIWIDPGLPVVTSPDGKRYKRLVAILVKDMDGRLDLNTHGNLAQLQPNHLVQTNVTLGLANNAQLPRGVGFGPAEVNLVNIFSSGGVPDVATYENILRQRYASNLTGLGPTVDTGNTAGPGIPNQRDGFSIVKLHGVPNNYPGEGNWYSSPPDVWGRGAYVLDYGGQPISTYSGLNNEMLDNPYEISLSGELTNADSPYTLVEMERLLRHHDPDAQYLPSRPLVAAAGYLNSAPGFIDGTHDNRERFRTHGASLPVPGTVAPPSVSGAAAVTQINRENNVPGQRTILDLYVQRLTGGGSTNVAQDFYKIVPWELRHGGKFNINRWLGDGFDSTGDFVNDDPTESFADPGNANPYNVAPYNGPRETAWLGGPTGFTGINAEHANGVDVNGDGAVNSFDRAMARQLYARHLFCLVMLFFDNTNFNANFPHEGTLTPQQKRELYIRRIAQWAVNVVDFRDSDAIMTPFEYDINPWNGWIVDGIVGGTSPDDTHPERRLVWGVESPELLLNESLVFHDRRVRDTDDDGGDQELRTATTNPDDDLDQYRRPEGSVFIELYCTRGWNWAGAGFANQKPRWPRELYNAGGQLELGKLAPDGWPVWRIAFSELSYNDVNADFPNAIKPNVMATVGGGAERLESGSFEATSPAPIDQPRDVSLVAGNWTNNVPTGPPGTVPLERYLWFNTQANLAATVGASPLATGSFYADNTFNAYPLLEPGQYAIVGPRALTYLGSHNPATVGPPATVPPNPAEEQAWGDFSQQTLTLGPGGMTITDTSGTVTTQGVGTQIRVAIPIVANVQGTPTDAINGAVWGTATSIGLNITEPLSGVYYPEPLPNPPPAMGNFPADLYDNPETPQKTFPDEPYDSRGNFPLGEAQMTQTGTYTDAASMYLQRLANPLLPYNAASNPYITVDWAALDVTVFTGEEDTDRQANMTDLDPSDPQMGRPNMKWATRQRGIPQGAPVTPVNPWPAWTDAPNDNGVPTGPASLWFRPSLDNTRHSLPFLNPTVGTPLNAMTGYLGEVDSSVGVTAPWLVHLNRPFANPFELLQVPSSSPSRRFVEFSSGLGTFLPAGANSVYNNGQPQNLRAPFMHLNNFFHSDASVANSPQWHRLLDYVEVPSPYTGAERWYNPANFGAAGLFRPPFNKMSRFRDPGLININTIFDSEVWSSAIGQFPGMNTQPFVDKVSRSRRGFTGGPLGLTDGSGNPIPTLFGNPFRPSDAADLMPNIAVSGVPMRRATPVESTLLRPDPDTATQPLFDNQGATQVHQDARRNAYFRYQALQKLGNTFTTHSNVFAVWMTIGYFEVEDNVQGGVTVVNAAHPDGLRLGPEIGADSGEIRRHRFFSIIDRSVPVGYVHGQKLNTDNCVQLRRMIE